MDLRAGTIFKIMDMRAGVAEPIPLSVESADRNYLWQVRPPGCSPLRPEAPLPRCPSQFPECFRGRFAPKQESRPEATRGGPAGTKRSAADAVTRSDARRG